MGARTKLLVFTFVFDEVVSELASLCLILLPVGAPTRRWFVAEVSELGLSCLSSAATFDEEASELL